MSIQTNTNPFSRAERKKSKLRLAIMGPAGSGKTYSAIRLARGITEKIALIDTENGSGDLYASLCNYDTMRITAPFSPKKYVDAIKAAEQAGYDVIIIDSLSHAWMGAGGILDTVDKKAASQNGGSNFNAWRDVTPQHNALVDAMLQSTSHIIATCRSKVGYDMEEYTDKNGNKRTKPVKIGLQPVQREGLDYEFTVVMDIDQNHNASTSKDRTSLFKDEVFTPDETVGERLKNWLNEGREDKTNLKREIMKLGEKLGINSTDATQWAFFMKSMTGLELVEENYDGIIARLETLVEERFAPKPVVPPLPPITDAEIPILN